MVTPTCALSTTATVFALTLLSGCGGDDSPTDPNVLDIAGTWNYQTTNVLVDGITCSITGRTMTITQNGDSFGGQLSGGVNNCSFESGFSSQDLGADGITDNIVNGTISGSSISFDLDVLPGTSLIGTVSGNTMSGTITDRVFAETGAIVSGTGSWSASR